MWPIHTNTYTHILCLCRLLDVMCFVMKFNHLKINFGQFYYHTHERRNWIIWGFFVWFLLRSKFFERIFPSIFFIFVRWQLLAGVCTRSWSGERGYWSLRRFFYDALWWSTFGEFIRRVGNLGCKTNKSLSQVDNQKCV
jgi:hypothetical protein